MKITLDTNVLISATFWYGPSFSIIEKVENKELELFLSEDIISEFSRVLESDEIQQKIKGKNLEMKRTIEKIISISQITKPKEKLDIIKEDQEDNKIIECALEGKVSYLISQDNHLLKLKEFQGIRIINPRDFLDLINKK